MVCRDMLQESARFLSSVLGPKRVPANGNASSTSLYWDAYSASTMTPVHRSGPR